MLSTLISLSPSKVLITILIDCAATTVVPVKTLSQFLHPSKIKVAILNAVFTFNVYEKKLINGVSAYDIIEKLDIYMQLVNKFPTLWKDDGFIHISSQE